MSILNIEKSSDHTDAGFLIKKLQKEKGFNKDRLDKEILERKLLRHEGLVFKINNAVASCVFSWSIPNKEYMEVGTLWISQEYRHFHQVLFDNIWNNIHSITNGKKICGQCDSLALARYYLISNSCPLNKIANYNDDEDILPSLCNTFQFWNQYDIDKKLRFHRILTKYNNKTHLQYFVYES